MRLESGQLRNGGLHGCHLAEIDEAVGRADRTREEGRPRARRTDDEHEPVVELAEAVAEGRAAAQCVALRHAKL